MTDNVDTGSPAPSPADTGSPNGGSATPPTPAPTPTDNPSPTPTTPPAFNLPDEYKEKPWAGKVKSQEDLYKQLDSLDQLVGKKSIGPIDYAKSTPEQIAEHHAKMAPADRSAYKFSVPDDPSSIAVGDAFIAAGVNEHQGQAIIKALAPFFEKADQDMKAKATDLESYTALSKEAFGENFKEATGKVEKILKEHAPDDATKKSLDEMDNTNRNVVDKVVSKIVEKYEERIANILKEHGIHESGAQGEGGKGKVVLDKAAQGKELRAKIRELSGNPHTQSQLQSLKDQLHALYQQK